MTMTMSPVPSIGGAPHLPTVPCTYCGQPTTYTATKHCDWCHYATHAPTVTLLKILEERGEAKPLLVAINRPYYPSVEFPGTLAEAKQRVAEFVADNHYDDGHHPARAVIAYALESVDLKTHY